jgi:hypothetical protein
MLPGAGLLHVRAQMATLRIRKLANAFVAGAAPSDLMPEFALSAVDGFKRKHGGLWVGGTVSVSQDGVSFSPNRLNQALHACLEPIQVPAKDIQAVRYEFGWFTGIVVVEHLQGEFRFRCYGAKRLAATMAASFNAS